MKNKVIKLNEQDLERLVKRVISEVWSSDQKQIAAIGAIGLSVVTFYVESSTWVSVVNRYGESRHADGGETFTGKIIEMGVGSDTKKGDAAQISLITPEGETVTFNTDQAIHMLDYDDTITVKVLSDTYFFTNKGRMSQNESEENKAGKKTTLTKHPAYHVIDELGRKMEDLKREFKDGIADSVSGSDGYHSEIDKFSSDFTNFIGKLEKLKQKINDYQVTDNERHRAMKQKEMQERQRMHYNRKEEAKNTGRNYSY